MQNEFQRRFCWGVLIAYSSIIFFGEFIHALPGMECCDGCSSGTVGACFEGACLTQAGSKRDSVSSPWHCVFCEKRGQKSTSTEASGTNTEHQTARSKDRLSIRNPSKPCQVCKMLAGFASSMLQCTETAFTTEDAPFEFLSVGQVLSFHCSAYSPRGPPQNLFL
jgi:hypothetical protein